MLGDSKIKVKSIVLLVTDVDTWKRSEKDDSDPVADKSLRPLDDLGQPREITCLKNT